MAITINHELAGENTGGIIPKGDYEAFISKCDIDCTQNGKLFIDMVFTVREDVEQACKKRTVFHKIWSVKDPSATDNVEGYPTWAIQGMSKSAAIENGKSFDTIEAWCSDMVGRVVQVVIDHEEYNDKTRAIAKFVNRSNNPREKFEVEGVTPNNGGDFIPANDTEIPF